MKINVLLGVTAYGIASFLPVHATAANCPKGKITCAEWCAKYNPGLAGNCMSGGERSCDAKPQKGNTCVRDPKATQ